MQAAYSPVHQTEAGQVDPPPAYEHPPQVSIHQNYFSGFKSNSQVSKVILRCLASFSTNLHLATDPNHCLNHQIRSISIDIVNIIIIIIMLINNHHQYWNFYCHAMLSLWSSSGGGEGGENARHHRYQWVCALKSDWHSSCIFCNVCTNQCTLWLLNCIEQWWIMIIALFCASSPKELRTIIHIWKYILCFDPQHAGAVVEAELSVKSPRRSSLSLSPSSLPALQIHTTRYSSLADNLVPDVW